MNNPIITGTKPLLEQAADKIRLYVKEHDMQVGDKLPNEFQLAEMCDVGRSTIREAIKLLIFEGVVEVIRGSGTFIAEQKNSISEDPIGLNDDSDLCKRALDFFDVRLILEPEVAALAAANATYADCQRLREAQKAVEDCISAKRDHLKADILFHTQIAECSKNKVVHNLTEIIVKGIPVFIEITRNSFANITVDHHRAIVDAIAAGDAVGARCAMITHLNHNRKKILKVAEENKK